MLPEELVRVALFVASLVVVYGLAILFAVLEVRRRLSGHAVPERTRLARGVRAAVLTLAGLGLLCMGWGFLIEPRWLEVTHVEIVSPKVPARLRIALISDLHCDAKPGLEESLPGVIAGEKPDLIVFAGDATNSKEGVPNFKRCLTRLATLAPVIAVKGNWDLKVGLGWKPTPEDDAARESLFVGTGARELDGDAACVESGVWVAGIRAWDSPERTAQALAAVPGGAFTIFVAHFPDEIEAVAPRGVDLYLAGHTHGGQVALPFYGALVTFSRFGKKYEGGLYHVGETWLYVTRGIGTDGAGEPRCRFLARPEVTILDVVPPR